MAWSSDAPDYILQRREHYIDTQILFKEVHKRVQRKRYTQAQKDKRRKQRALFMSQLPQNSSKVEEYNEQYPQYPITTSTT